MKQSNDIEIKGLFPVKLNCYSDGSVLLTDIQGRKSKITNKDGSGLTDTQLQEIIDNKWGYWSLVRRFNLV